ncbi:hypothetical protein BLNAU_16681 [Blattamonas nauphoetae]|uniref:non-specific serine/threonine protein kinase n=1 Tax=Blattamonas nauphoetae TaxID=2049346 RepID=A0ABQ9XAH9_9EUKA|nr:hypothetical protein BLNAU_16681 [Blattamonas nauphoetae]
MNWVDGYTLYQIEEHTRCRVSGVRTEKPEWNVIPEHAIFTILCQCLLGIYSIHNLDLMHRDITPGNIIITPVEGQHIKVTICDLGCARENDGVDLSDVGTTLFKPLNAKVMGQNVYTEKRDILGLGKTMYFIMFHDYYRDYPRQIAIDTSRYKLAKTKENKDKVYDDEEEEEADLFPYSPELLEIIARMLNEDDLPSAETLLKTKYLYRYARLECKLMNDSIEQKLWSQRLAEWKPNKVDWGSPHINEEYDNKRVYMNTTSQDFADPDQVYQVPPSVLKDHSEVKTLFEALTNHHP